LEWMLLTDLFIGSFDEAVEKVKWHALRWRIEVFHKILKSGLRVEACLPHPCLQQILKMNHAHGGAGLGRVSVDDK